MKKTIIFDFFGVISSEVAPFWFAERFDRDTALRLKEEYMGPSDRGDVSEEETFARLALLTGEDALDIYDDFCRRAVINEDTVAVIKRLKKSYRIVLLSNAMSAWLKGILSKNDLYSLFDYTIISADEHIAKPDKRIFELALERAGIAAEDAVFIDDNPKNVDAARGAGIDGIIFKDAESLEVELREKGIIYE